MGSVGAIVAILASAVIVVGGLVALARAVWKAAQTIRDNIVATRALTTRFDKFDPATEARLAALEGRMTALETHPPAPGS